MFESKKILVVAATFFLFALSAGVQIAYCHGEQAGVPDGYRWMKSYTLFITDSKNIDEAYEAAAAVEQAGGHVAVIIPNRVMLGWVPENKADGLVGTAHIKRVHQKALSRDATDVLLGRFPRNEASRNAVEFFNEVASGAYVKKRAAADAIRQANAPRMLADLRESPPVSYKDFMENLANVGIREEALSDAGISVKADGGNLVMSPGNSDHMVGKIGFAAIYLESSGKVDTNEFSWTDADRKTIQAEIVQGLTWWTEIARHDYNTPITFIYQHLNSWRTSTQYEPIRHPSSDDGLWINEVMAKFGHTSGDKFARTDAFNTKFRKAYKTNWAVVSFIAYNPSPAPNTFTNGDFAYAYSGHYSQLLYINENWGVNNYNFVNDHETGHLFGALDEYYTPNQAFCNDNSCRTKTSKGVYNGNCEHCNTNAVSCMMRRNTYNLCGYTAGQLGWHAIRDVSPEADSTSGPYKAFYAAGEPFQPKTYLCINGPDVPGNQYTLRARWRADFLTGSLGNSGTTAVDTGWKNLGETRPPVGLGPYCVWAWAPALKVPSNVASGPATIDVQVEISGIGRGAGSNTNVFYVAPGAIPAPPLSPLADVETLDCPECFVEPAPPPGK